MKKTVYPLTDVPWSERRMDAIEAAFGPPKTVRAIPFPIALLQKTPPIHVWEWPDYCGRGKTLLMTEGLSDVALQDDGEPAPYRLELLTVATSKDRLWAGNALRICAESFVSLYECLFMSLGHTMAINNPVQPLEPGSQLTRFVFLQPPSMLLEAGEQLMSFKIKKKPLFVMWCTGIAEEELPMLKELDEEEFGRRLEAHSLVFDPKRSLLPGSTTRRK